MLHAAGNTVGALQTAHKHHVSGIGIHRVLAAWCPAMKVFGSGDIRGKGVSSKQNGIQVHTLALNPTRYTNSTTKPGSEPKPELVPKPVIVPTKGWKPASGTVKRATKPSKPSKPPKRSRAEQEADAVVEAITAAGYRVVATEVPVQSPDRTVSSRLDALAQHVSAEGTSKVCVLELKTGGGGTGRHRCHFDHPLGSRVDGTPLGFATAQAAAGLYMARAGPRLPMYPPVPVPDWVPEDILVVTVQHDAVAKDGTRVKEDIANTEVKAETGAGSGSGSSSSSSSGTNVATRKDFNASEPVRAVTPGTVNVKLYHNGEGVLADPSPSSAFTLGAGVVVGRPGSPHVGSLPWLNARAELLSLGVPPKAKPPKRKTEKKPSSAPKRRAV